MTSRADDELSPFDDDDFQMLLHVSARRIVDNESDPDAFLAWARDAYPGILPDLKGNGGDGSLPAYWLARAVWNATPLAGNHYRPRPLPPPQRNDRCPCGSGRKFKQCCRNLLDEVPTLPEALMWQQLFACLTDKHWVTEAKAARIPVLGLVMGADYFASGRRWRPLKALAEAAIGEQAVIRDERLALLIDPLCDAYDALYRTDRNKAALLERLSGHPLEAVRSEACQRLASWLHDQGDDEAAWTAFHQALRATPDNPALAALEITLLAAEGRYDQLRQRAAYWRRRMERLQDVPDDLLDLLEQVEADPRGALAKVTSDTAPAEIGELLEWVARYADREIPALCWEALSADPDDEMLRDAYEPQLDEEQHGLVEQWNRLAGLPKPFSVQWFSGDEMRAWECSDDWLPWLMSHPQALDSFDVLDDLVALLDATEHHLSLMENPWLDKLIDRGVTMLLAHWPEDRPGCLPWIVTANRPALRILSKAILREERDEAALPLLSAYLRLNPSDNHGFRSVLMNRLLQWGRDAPALELSGAYPNDDMVELLYGRVLALYRSGRRGEALQALADAVRQRPLVLDYLLRATVSRPKIDESGILLGGKDEAWLYRDAMRGTWLATEGMFEWLNGARRTLKRRSGK
ncbi:MAG: SEC-C metal-binding domain-containing protein [Pseudomonadales bacterium]